MREKERPGKAVRIEIVQAVFQRDRPVTGIQEVQLR